MIANKWYCIAQTSTFDTRCSINVAFDGHDIQFSASVKYGASSINITRCIIPDGISFSIRLRESGSQWFVDITSSAKITPVVTVADSEYWSSVNKPAAEGNIILLLTDITSKYNTSSFGGDSLFELVNVGTSDVPRYAVVPKVFQGQNPGVISRTFMTFGGLGADSNGEDDPSGVSYLRNLLDVRLSEFLEDSDVLTYDKNQDLWVNKKGGFNEEKLEEYLEKYKYITEDDIKGLLVLLQWFEFDDANHAVRVKSDFNFVVPNALSFGGLGSYSGGGEGGVSYLKNLLDVQLGTLLEDGEVLVYDKHLDRWVNKSIETGLDVDSLQKYLTDNKYITSADVDGLQGQINNNATNIALLLSWLEYDEVNKALRVKNGYNFIVDGALSFGGLGEDDNPTPGGLTQVTIQLGNNPNDSYVSENGKVILPAYPVIPTLLSAFENDKGYLVVSDLNGYAKLTDIPSVEGFALTEDLNALSKQIEGYNNKFADVGESILDIEEDISKLAPLADLEKLEEAVNPLFGYFDANGSANNALKLGGQLPSYYATVDALNLVKNDVTAVSNRVQKFEDVIDIDKNGDVYIKGTRNFYTEGGTIGMAGLGSGGSGGGGAAGIVTVRVNGYDYNSVNGIVTLPDYPSLSGYATQSWVGDNYLPLSGGRLNGKGVILVTNSTDGKASAINLQSANVNKGQLCWDANSGIFIYNYESDKYLGIKNDGTPFYSNNTLLHSGNYSSYALPLTGGTISNNTAPTPLVVNSNTSVTAMRLTCNSANKIELGWDGSTGTYLFNYASSSYLSIKDDGTPNYNGNTLYHTGNFNPANYLPLSGGEISNSNWGTTLTLNGDGTDAGLKFTNSKNFRGLLYTNTYGRLGWYDMNGVDNTVIHSGNIGSYNAGSATKLQTARTIWGQSFDGSGDVSGAMSGVNSIVSNTTDGYFVGNRNDGLGVTTGGLLLYSYKATPISFYTNKKERMHITADGNVLIGATEDISWVRLNVEGGVRTSDYVSFYRNSKEYGYVGLGSSSSNEVMLASVGRLYIEGATNILLNRSSSSGNVIIGHSADNGYKLDVRNSVTKSYDFHIFNSSTNSSFFVGFDGLWYGTSKTSGQIFTIMSGCSYDGGGGNPALQVTAEGNLTVTGDITSEGTMAMAKLASSSDRKLKDNIAEVSAEQSMSIIRQLRPTTWNWKKDGKKSYGFIAQEVEPIVPEMVVNMGHLHLEYNQLHAFEIGAIQHIDSEVEILKRRVTELENELKQYRRA